MNKSPTIEHRARPKQSASAQAKFLWGSALCLSILGLLVFAGSMLVRTTSPDDTGKVLTPESKENQASAPDPSAKLGHAPKQTAQDEYPRLQQAIEQRVQNTRVDSTEDLDRELAKLFDQAHNNGRVTALEVETGARLIMKHSADIEQQIQFERDMQQLQKDLNPPAPKAPRAVAQGLPSSLLARIEHGEGKARDDQVQDYLRAVDQLPPEEQIEATLALDEVTSSAVGRQDPIVLDSLLQGIENAEDEDTRAAFTHDYVTAMGALSLEEQIERSQSLNQLSERIKAP